MVQAQSYEGMRMLGATVGTSSWIVHRLVAPAMAQVATATGHNHDRAGSPAGLIDLKSTPLASPMPRPNPQPLDKNHEPLPAIIRSASA